jgi:threonine dehydrogenase-like Zn-dependent dehydrogenase
MRQLLYTSPGRCEWREVPDPAAPGPGQALVQPVAVACCDLDVGVVQGRAPLSPGFAVGHEGIGDVVAVGENVSSVRVGDRVIVPFQINCGDCQSCRRGQTSSCEAVPPRAMYGLGSIAGLDGGGFLADFVMVPYADAMLVVAPADADPVALASLSDNIPDGWRTVGPHRDLLAAVDPVDRRVLVLGGLSVGLYAAAFAAALGAHVDYLDTDPARLVAAEKLGATVHDRIVPDRRQGTYPITVNTSADPQLLGAALRSTWPGGVCTDTGIYFENDIVMPLFEMYSSGITFVTGRANARADLPAVLDALSGGRDLSPAVDRVVPWNDADHVWPTMESKVIYTR